jgi:hypothetical protein
MLSICFFRRFLKRPFSLRALAVVMGVSPPCAVAQPEGPAFTLRACVKPEHRRRLLGEEDEGSRRLLLLGDSHMDRATINRVAEAIQKTWPIDDWVSRTSTYKQGAAQNIRSGTYMRLGRVAEFLQREYRPGTLMFGGRVVNDIAILSTVGPMPGPTDEAIFTQLLSKASDSPYATSASTGANWYDDHDVVGRPIMYWDGTGTDTVRSFRYSVHRGEGVGLFPALPRLFVQTLNRETVYAAPFVRARGDDAGELKLTVSGNASENYTGKYFVTIGSQFALCDENNVPLPGFALDTYAPFGWNTNDHMRSSGPGRHYLDDRAIEYLNATRLRADERMTVMILLGHSDGGANAVQHEERMRLVIERWRTLCSAAGYTDPHFVLVHPWAITGFSLTTQRAHAQSYQRIASEWRDVSFISIAEATSYAFFDGKHNLPNYLDQLGIHWGNPKAVAFFGRLMWSLLINNDSCASCYADCDTSTGKNTIDIFDFICFQNSFINASRYACDCDTSTGSGVCDIFDFLCFQTAFIAGCPPR